MFFDPDDAMCGENDESGSEGWRVGNSLDSRSTNEMREHSTSPGRRTGMPLLVRWMDDSHFPAMNLARS